MATVRCHSNQSSYPIGTKTILFVPPAYRSYVKYMYGKYRLHGVRGDIVWKWWRSDDDERRMPIYNMLPMSRWAKKLIEKSRECHNHKPQPAPDTKRKRKWTKINTCKINKSALSSPNEVITMLKGLRKKNTRTKRMARLNMKCPILKTTKPHKIRTRKLWCKASNTPLKSFSYEYWFTGEVLSNNRPKGHTCSAE